VRIISPERMKNKEGKMDNVLWDLLRDFTGTIQADSPVAPETDCKQDPLEQKEKK